MPGILNYKVALSKDELEKLKLFFTDSQNPSYNIFTFENTLTEEEKALIAARFSRSKEISIQKLFLKEILRDEDIEKLKGLEKVSKNNKKISEINKRIISDYGDDSVLDMVSAIVGIEGIDQVSAKIIEDCRLCGYIEKSTRFVNFSNPLQLNEKGEIIGYADEKYSNSKKYYLYRTYEPIESSNLANTYNQAMDELFATFSKVLEKTIVELKNKMPLSEQEFPDQNDSKNKIKYERLSEEDKKIAEKAYNMATKAKAFDICRAILPMSTITNLAWSADFRSFTNTLIKMYASEDPEAAKIAESVYNVLYTCAPSLISKVKNKHSQDQINYLKNNQQKLHQLEKELEQLAKGKGNEYDVFASSDKVNVNTKNVRLLRADNDESAKLNIATNLMVQDSYMDREKILRILQENTEFVNKIINTINKDRDNRWKKLPRAFESTNYTVALSAPISVYRDLQRNRFVLHIPKSFTVENGYIIPKLIYDIGFDGEFKDKITSIENVYTELKMNKKLEGYANRAVTFAHIIKWIDIFNLREADWYIRLRTSAQGDDVYRELMFKLYNELRSAQPDLIKNSIKPGEDKIGQLNRAMSLFKRKK